MAEKNPNKFYKILCKKLQPIADARARDERQVRFCQAKTDSKSFNQADSSTVEREDDAILSEHIDRTLKSGHHSPTPRLPSNVVDEVRNSHTNAASIKSAKVDFNAAQQQQQQAQSNSHHHQPDQPCFGPLPAFGREMTIDTHSKVLYGFQSKHLLYIHRSRWIYEQFFTWMRL